MAGPPPRGLLLFVAQGFGIGGRIPAPGTWGTLLGLPLVALLVWPGNYWFYLIGTVLLVLVSIPVCTAAEQRLNQKDPGTVVLDESVAMPVCFLGWVTDCWLATGQCGIPALLAHYKLAWLLIVIATLGFRFFDILKPWPIRWVQRYSGGWGIVLDDLLAAIPVAVILLMLGWVM